MMFLFAELTKEIVFVCTIFISFTLKITCEICFWYCQGNQKTEDIFINGFFLTLIYYSVCKIKSATLLGIV